MLHSIINKHNNEKKIISLFIGILAIILLFIFVPSLLLNNNLNTKKAKKVKISAVKVVPSKNNTSLKNTTLKAKPSSSSSNVSNASKAAPNTTNQPIPGYGVKIEDAFNKDGKKTAYLTFDDGPSTTVTPKILDTLKNYNVHGTFFLLGKMIDENPSSKIIVKRTFDEGNSIGNHTYSHSLKLLYPGNVLNVNQFMSEVDTTSNILKGILGQAFSTRLIRMPGGYMSRKHYNDPNLTQFDNILKQRNMASVDWNAYDFDAEGARKNSYQLLEHVKSSVGNQSKVIILMHDTYGKEETAKALPSIIEFLKSSGYEFKTLY